MAEKDGSSSILFFWCMEEGYGLRLPFLLAAFPTTVGVSTPWCLLMHPVTLSLTDCGGYAGDAG